MSEPWVAPGSSTPPESADHGQAGPPHVGSEPPRPYAAPPGSGSAPPPPYAAPPGFGSAPPPPYPAATHSVPPQGVAPHGVAPAGVPGAWRPAFDFRPGIIPLRPLQLGDLLSGVFKAVRGNVAATVGLAALTSALVLVPFTALGTWIASRDDTPLLPSQADPLGPDDPFGGSDPFTAGMFATYLPSIASVVSTILLAGFLAYVIGQAVLGRKVTMGETWAGTKGRLLALVGGTALVSLLSFVVLAIGIGIPVAIGIAIASSGADLGTGGVVVLVLLAIVWLLLLVVAFIVVATRLSFLTPALILERLGVIAALKRSWSLVGGPFRMPLWRVFGLRLLTSIVVGIASSIITTPLTLVMIAAMVALGASEDATFGQLFGLQTLITGLVGILAGALTTPFTAGVDALLYVDARIRQEGLDVTLMQAAQGSAPPPWPAANARP